MMLEGMLLRAILLWVAVTRSISYTLDMNCTSEGLTGSACMNYMRDYISNYILVQKKYNKDTLPVLRPYWGEGVPSPGDVYDIVSVKVQLTMKNLVSLDSAAGSMSTAVFLDIYWRDDLLNWDPQWTDGYEFFDIDYTLLWTPDILLYNSIGKYSDQMGKPALFLSSNGDAWWDASGLLTFSCEFDTTKFPFDSQTCEAVFGSWTYASYELNITEAIVIVDDTFSNIAWEVQNVNGAVTQAVLWEEYPYNFAIYSFQLGRYYNHYVSNAIVPSLLVTFLSLISLWIDDAGVRLSIGITALLALIAVQWTVSSEIPVSRDEPWLSKLSNVCIVYTTVVCIEGYMIGYMRSKHERAVARGDRNFPPSIKILIDLSHSVDATAVYLRRRGVFLAFVLCGAVGTLGASAAGRPTGSAHSEHPPPKQDADRESSIGTAVELTTNPMSSKSYMTKEPEDADSAEQNDASAELPTAEVSTIGNAHATHALLEEKYSWAQATTALDHLSRIALPTSYCIILLVFLSEVA